MKGMHPVSCRTTTLKTFHWTAGMNTSEPRIIQPIFTCFANHYYCFDDGRGGQRSPMTLHKYTSRLINGGGIMSAHLGFYGQDFSVLLCRFSLFLLSRPFSLHLLERLSDLRTATAASSSLQTTTASSWEGPASGPRHCFTSRNTHLD